MSDFQVVRLQDVIPVTTITSLPGVSPRSVRLGGTDFRNVETVWLNGSLSPEFVVVSQTEIWAQVPEDQLSAAITNAYVLSTNLSLTERSLVELSIGKAPKLVGGILLLVQTFTRMLLRSPGTDAFHPTLGGGLLRSIGKVMGANARDRIGADLAVAVARTKQQIIAAQTPNRNIPPSERLRSAEVVGLSVDQQAGTVYASVSITTQAGTTAAATLIG